MTDSKVEEYSSAKYLEYAVSSLVERALPHVNDGLKPVHRRILYSMSLMGIKAGFGKVKSARIVGDIIGKYHPHGDVAVYDTMVRMSQNWVMRYPLIKGQGNFGSRDGDSAAAMRYTEASLTLYAEHILLSELNKGTSDYIDNYDGSLVEAKFLSSRLNNLLLNGSEGIAVGMATMIPSHNIRELTNATIAYINNNNITTEEIMAHLIGPDFASGGQIVSSKSDILKAYKTGYGKIRVRARWHIEKMTKGNWQIVVTELPPKVSIVNVLVSIDKILNPINEKDKSGKINARVVKNKMFLNSILSKGKNDTDAKTGDRLVLEPKSKKQDPIEFMNALVPLLGLEDTFGINLVAVGFDGRPELKNVIIIIKEWVNYRLKMIKRKLNFYLIKTKKRIHIVEGRLEIYDNLDMAIKIIRTSNNPKEKLIDFFNISDLQADDILEIKLKQLSKIEKETLNNELNKQNKEKVKFENLLCSEKRLFSLMKKDIEIDTVKFEDKRRTLILETKTIANKVVTDCITEPLTILFTKDGWITKRKGHGIDTANSILKQGDHIVKQEEVMSNDCILFLSSLGRAYSLRTDEIVNGNNFSHINSLLDTKGGQIINMMQNKKEDFLFLSSDGYGFVSNSINLLSKNKAGKSFMRLSSCASVILHPIKITNEKRNLTLITKDLKVLSFNISEVKSLNGGKGVQLIKLTKGDLLIDAKLTSCDKITLTINNKKKMLTKDEIKKITKKRARTGVKLGD